MGPIDLLIQNWMIPFLKFSYQSIYPNYGMSIILLTVLVKMVFYPLTKKQFVQMKINQKIQPQIKEIQEKYKKQPEKMHKEMSALWKANNANPLSGCLPALVQLPFFFAIFYTIQSESFTTLLAGEGVNKGFLVWSDITLMDPFFVLPVAIGLLTYWSQKFMVTDPKQSKIFMFMPFMMVFICFKMPIGVLLYWVISQLISTLQQVYIMKKAV